MRWLWEQCKGVDGSDVLFVVGAGVLGYGLYQWWPPAAWMAIGCILLLIWCIVLMAAILGRRR